MNLRVGQGFDLHRLESGRSFVLGGLTLDWPKGPVGHSDGDTLLHAVTDALLGAAGLGDIGDWFSPTDPQWAGADSRELLTRVVAQVHKDGWQVVNVDATVLLEAPKLGPHKVQLRQHLADTLGLPIEAVSIKAKTMEGLGAIGQQEAVAALATVLLQKP